MPAVGRYGNKRKWERDRPVTLNNLTKKLDRVIELIQTKKSVEDEQMLKLKEMLVQWRASYPDGNLFAEDIEELFGL